MIVCGGQPSTMDDLSNRPAARVPAKLSAHRREYARRVNRVMDYAQAHLADELTLEKLAAVAAFSPFHFHRVFAAITGETLSDFIRRIRLERAASALGLLHDTSVLEIALIYGFSSAATFARAFKAHFGMSATEWRDGGARQWTEARRNQSKPGKAVRNKDQAQRNLRKASSAPFRHGAPARLREVAKGLNMQVEVRQIPRYRVAYMRHVGPYGRDIGAFWTAFERWMTARDLRQAETITIGIGHDAPLIADADKLRYDACVVVDDAFKPDRYVNVTELAGGRYAVAQYKGAPSDVGYAWEQLFTNWLPSSGYQPEDRPCLELYQDSERRRAPQQLHCELCIPIKPL
jgi:AraC family transcriptional regulator